MNNAELEQSDFGTAGTVGYWANNFNDFSSGVVVLFELMVVNNWYVIAGGLAAVAPGNSAVGWLFCISFYFCIHIVILNVLVTSVVECYERVRTKSQEEARRRHMGQFQSQAVSPTLVSAKAMESAASPPALVAPAVVAEPLPPRQLSKDSTATPATLSSPLHPRSEISDLGCRNGANDQLRTGTSDQTRLTDLSNLGSHLDFFSGAVDSLSVEAEANSRLGELEEHSLLLDRPTRKARRNENLKRLKTLSSLSTAVVSERADIVRTESSMTSAVGSDVAGDGSGPVQRRWSSSSCIIQEEQSLDGQTHQPADAVDWAPICQSPGLIDPL